MLAGKQTAADIGEVLLQTFAIPPTGAQVTSRVGAFLITVLVPVPFGERGEISTPAQSLDKFSIAASASLSLRYCTTSLQITRSKVARVFQSTTEPFFQP